MACSNAGKICFPSPIRCYDLLWNQGISDRTFIHKRKPSVIFCFISWHVYIVLCFIHFLSTTYNRTNILPYSPTVIILLFQLYNNAIIVTISYVDYLLLPIAVIFPYPNETPKCYPIYFCVRVDHSF